jgi:hypothetical protein
MPDDDYTEMLIESLGDFFTNSEPESNDEALCAQDLERYASLQHELLALENQRQELIRRAIDSLGAAASASYEEIVNRHGDLTTQAGGYADAIRILVSRIGHTVNGGEYQAVYNKPRETWDSKMLERLKDKYPEIEKARRVSDAPSVSVRKAMTR